MFLPKHLIYLCAITFISCTIFIKHSNSERILSLAFWSSRSHKITYQSLLEELSNRGHEITIVSPVKPSGKPSNKNIHEVFTYDTEILMEKHVDAMIGEKDGGSGFDPKFFVTVLTDICTNSLTLPQVQALRNQKFDLIFVQALFNECALGFASTFNTSVIAFSPVSVSPHVSSLYGNPSPPSFVPGIFLPFKERMTFLERTINLLVEGVFRSVFHFYYLPKIEETYRRVLGDHLPGWNEIIKNTSIMLSNSHFSIGTIRPFLPDIIEIGGMHCRPAKPLPDDLENFVNSSRENGFILFSMGSVLKSSKMTSEKKEMFLRAFARVKQNVIWKWEEETKENLPKNVKLVKWLPQQDLLGHPKIRGFITHGGFGSTTEASYHGVPLIGIPMFADQGLNMMKAEDKGYAIQLSYKDLTEDKIVEAINTIVDNPSYMKTARKLSEIFRDQPTKPLDRAVYWSEYVMRHKGAHHLRSSARELNFFQYHSIDVIGFLTGVLLLAILIIYSVFKLIMKCACKILFSNKTNNTSNKKKKQ